MVETRFLSPWGFEDTDETRAVPECRLCLTLNPFCDFVTCRELTSPFTHQVPLPLHFVLQSPRHPAFLDLRAHLHLLLIAPFSFSHAWQIEVPVEKDAHLRAVEEKRS